MTKIVKITGFCAAIVLGAVGFTNGQVQPVNPPVTANIDTTKLGAPISPYLYGQFLEHIGNLIYSNLWCEKLEDRKFYFPIGPEEQSNAVPAAARGSTNRSPSANAPHWTAIGPLRAILMDSNRPFAGEHSPQIFLDTPGPHGIRQRGLSLNRLNNYYGRVSVKGDPTASVAVSLTWGTNASQRETVRFTNLTAEYRTFPLAFVARENSTNGILEITGAGTGSIHIGAIDLMPAVNTNGFQVDAVEALKSLHSGVYRFPGGNFVSAHDWRNAIGNRDQRPPVRDPVWSGRRGTDIVQPNDIGTEEFLDLCRMLEVEPYITVNAGLGDAASAADYVEYANGAATNRMGKLRAANGHLEPYNVKYWGIGNEAWGDWQAGALPLDQFEAKHNEFARAMKAVDPTIKLVASGAMPDTMTGSKQSLRFGTNLVADYLSPADWTGGLLQHCFDNFDLISEHFYNYANTHFDLAAGAQVTNSPNEPLVDWMRRPANHVRIKFEEYQQYEARIAGLKSTPKPINLDEWAYSRVSGYRVVPAYAEAFNEMFRHSDVFQMAAFTFATAMLSHQGGETTLSPAGVLFKMYRDDYGTIPVAVTGNSPPPKPTAPTGGEQPATNAGSDTYPLDVAAAWTSDHLAVTVAIVNPTASEQSLKLNYQGANFSSSGILWRLAPDNLDADSVSVEETGLTEVPTEISVPKWSVSIYHLQIKRQ